MKAAQFWVEIVCWKCSNHCYGQWVTGGRIPIKVFRQEAKDRKWRETTSGEFECPPCTKEWMKELGLEVQP